MVVYFAVFYTIKWRKPFDVLLSTLSSLQLFHFATRYELCFWYPRIGEERAYPGKTFARRFNAIGVELFMRKHGYSEGNHDGLRLESATPMVLKHLFHYVINIISHHNLRHFIWHFASFHRMICGKLQRRLMPTRKRWTLPHKTGGNGLHPFPQQID